MTLDEKLNLLAEAALRDFSAMEELAQQLKEIQVKLDLLKGEK